MKARNIYEKTFVRIDFSEVMKDLARQDIYEKLGLFFNLVSGEQTLRIKDDQNGFITAGVAVVVPGVFGPTKYFTELCKLNPSIVQALEKAESIEASKYTRLLEVGNLLKELALALGEILARTEGRERMEEVLKGS